MIDKTLACYKDGQVCINPMPGQVLKKQSLKPGTGIYEGEDVTDLYSVDELSEANLISSRVKDKDSHKIILDIDMPVKAIPSSTEGHFYLYIDKELTWTQYANLLWVLADVGIIEEGYFKAAINRKYTSVRLPWIKKGDEGNV